MCKFSIPVPIYLTYKKHSTLPTHPPHPQKRKIGLKVTAVFVLLSYI